MVISVEPMFGAFSYHNLSELFIFQEPAGLEPTFIIDITQWLSSITIGIGHGSSYRRLDEVTI